MKLIASLAAAALFFGSTAVAQPTTSETNFEEIVFISEPVIQPIPEQPEQPSVEYDERQLDCIARVMHHEARGEGRKGQLAVGYVVLNRAEDPRFPSTPCRVATQPWQFSYFKLNRTVRNYDYYYSLAQEIVSDYDQVNDPSKGALYFHATYVKPRWSYQKRRSARIRQHIFYH